MSEHTCEAIVERAMRMAVAPGGVETCDQDARYRVRPADGEPWYACGYHVPAEDDETEIDWIDQRSAAERERDEWSVGYRTAEGQE